MSMAFFLATLFFSCLDPIEDGTFKYISRGNLIGQVKDICTNKGLANIIVSISDKETITDSEGNYRIENIVSGDYIVSFYQRAIDSKNYQPTSPSKTIKSGEENRLDVNLYPQIEAITSPKLDLLMVIDNSSSMAPFQADLIDAFPKFLTALNVHTKSGGGISTISGVDLRVGIISTDMGAGYEYIVNCSEPGGDSGELLVGIKNQCEVGTDSWIEVNTNAEDSMKEANELFSCWANLGVYGCGFEQPLIALKEAMRETLNPGFHREDATLAILIFSDEDDCSAADFSIFDGNEEDYGRLDSLRCFRYGVDCGELSNEEQEKWDAYVQEYKEEHKNDPEESEPPVWPRPELSAGIKEKCRPATGEIYQSFLYHPNQIVESILAVKPEQKLFVGVIAGPTDYVEISEYMDSTSNPITKLNHSCTSIRGGAVPAVRLKAFTENFGARGAFYSICEPDYGALMYTIAQNIVASTALKFCK